MSDKPTPGANAPDTDQQRTALPSVDVFEDEGGITLLADMPGVAKDRLELKVDGDELLIDGALQLPTPAGMESSYAEMSATHLRRRFTLSRELDASRIDASLKDGVLTLRIPKQAKAQPRRIPIGSA